MDLRALTRGLIPLPATSSAQSSDARPTPGAVARPAWEPDPSLELWWAAVQAAINSQDPKRWLRPRPELIGTTGYPLGLQTNDGVALREAARPGQSLGDAVHGASAAGRSLARWVVVAHHHRLTSLPQVFGSSATLFVRSSRLQCETLFQHLRHTEDARGNGQVGPRWLFHGVPLHRVYRVLHEGLSASTHEPAESDWHGQNDRSASTTPTSAPLLNASGSGAKIKCTPCLATALGYALPRPSLLTVKTACHGASTAPCPLQSNAPSLVSKTRAVFVCEVVPARVVAHGLPSRSCSVQQAAIVPRLLLVYDDYASRHAVSTHDSAVCQTVESLLEIVRPAWETSIW